MEQLAGTRVPWLPGYRVKILDGNCIEASERRLNVVREVQAGALPGKSLVVYEPAHGLVSDGFPCEDGHAQARSLFGLVLETVRAGVCGFKTGMSVPVPFCAKSTDGGPVS